MSNRKIFSSESKTRQALSLLIWGVDALKMNKYTTISKADTIGLLKLCSTFHTQQPLIFGLLAAFWCNFLLVILFFLEMMNYSKLVYLCKF